MAIAYEQYEEPDLSQSFGSDQVVNNRIEVLRQILGNEQRRDVSYDEAAEIGESLVQFFEVLGESATSKNDTDPSRTYG